MRRGWCVVAMETPSPSLIIIWGKMARGLLPRVTPPPRPFSRLRFLSFPSTLAIAVAAPLLLLLPPRLLSNVLHLALLFRHLLLLLLVHLLRRLLLLRLLLLIRLHLTVSSHRGTYFARLGNIMLAPYQGDCVTILNSL